MKELTRNERARRGIPALAITKDWLRTSSAQEFISSLSAVRQILPTELVVVKQGGDPKMQGTWVHEDVALEFARWLSPKFAIWCNDRIKELLTTGSVSLALPQDYASALRALADQVDTNQRLSELNAAQRMQIKTLAPKADFADQLFRVEDKIRLGTCAKALGLPFGQNTLFKKLRGLGIMFKHSTEVCQRYIDAGYFVMETRHICKGSADFMVNVTYATLKGLAYLGYLFGRKPNEEQAKAMFARALQMDALDGAWLVAGK